jgi:7,8-dihydropterin-6-yl-methyl-4-(beta-D-ribofuranosyl)aminobenzene 5'-phosphate synthase
LKTTVTVLCENTAGFPMKIIGEHGLSVLIERGDDRLLFDTGQGIGLVSNAQRLGKDLSRVRRAALSHGHYDHTGGLAGFLDLSGQTTVFAHPDVFIERFAQFDTPDGPKTMSIGIPFSRKDLERKGARFDLSPALREIAPGVTVTGEIPRPTDWKSWDKRLVVRDGDGFRPDPFRDDLSLILETGKGAVLILGCAHAGLHAIVDHVRAETGLDRFHAILGGTHLGAGTQEDWEKALELLEACRVEKMATSHCTGFQAASFLACRLGNRVAPASAGISFEF